MGDLGHVRRQMIVWTKRILLGSLGLIAFALSLGVCYEQWTRWRVWRDHPPPGDIVEFEGARSHLNCTGEGAPTVILESGLDMGGSTGWVSVQPEIARSARVCSYDRAGYMWSEGRGGPRDAARIADELHALLTRADIPPPYIMVGHSVGGPLVRVFDHRFPDEVVGFVFVDISHPEQSDRLPMPPNSRSDDPPTFLIRLVAASGLFRIEVPGEPHPGLPRDVAAIVDAYGPSSMPALFGEIAAIEAIDRQAGATGSIGARPLIVLTAAKEPPRLPPGVSWTEMSRAWLELQTELVALSTSSDHRVIETAGHYIQLDEPGAVIQAIEDALAAVRQGTPVDSPGD